MLIEAIAAAAVLLSSCDVTKAALGACGASCAAAPSTPGSFTLCETTTITKPGGASSSGPSAPKPQRLCSYYANNSIDVPTLTIIQAWVDVGSRLCIGDTVVEKPVVYKPVTEQLEDIFKASISNPRAWLVGPEDPEPYEEISFEVDAVPVSISGSLSGRSATIRFRPVGFSWSFSDGQSGQGRQIAHAFDAEGDMFARALVRYEVDYQVSGAWSQSVASWSLSSNQVRVRVVDPPRRALLVP